MLKKLSLKGVGPAPEMEVEFAERLTVITGDNGLGKSFILDAVWYSGTHHFFDGKILPQKYRDINEIKYEFSNGKQPKGGFAFNRAAQQWFPEHTNTYKLPIVYMSSDGKFGFYEPERAQANLPYASIYSSKEIMSGHIDKSRIACSGLINDFSKWYRERGKLFSIIQDTLETLSDDGDIPLCLATPQRISIEDDKDIPHLITPGGIEPITISSSGIRRIASLAYTLCWAWNEHKIACEITGQTPRRSLLILIDEIETHLHPKWQRKILVAVLEVAKAITQDKGFKVQVICTTHSPIILTGIEPHFDPGKDKLLDLQLIPSNTGDAGKVELREVDWYKRGTVGNWLTSDMFNVSERSPEAEAAIAAAAVFGDPLRPDVKPNRLELQKVDRALRDTLADTDRFLLRWEYLLEQRGWTNLLRGQ